MVTVAAAVTGTGAAADALLQGRPSAARMILGSGFWICLAALAVLLTIVLWLTCLEADAFLAAWNARFQAAWPGLRGPGFDERFRRLWTYYLAYCEAGFRTGTLDVRQTVLRPI